MFDFICYKCKYWRNGKISDAEGALYECENYEFSEEVDARRIGKVTKKK